MYGLINHTRFAATILPSADKRGQELLLVVVSGTFELPLGGQALDGAPRLAEQQDNWGFDDIYQGEPGLSSLRREGQSAYVRLGTDIYLEGSAWTPRGRPASKSLAGIRVGAIEKNILVIGDRRWRRGIVRISPSEPSPFVTVPLTYERSFGGAAAKVAARARNPVGQGGYISGREALDQPLPNLEDPQRPIEAPDSDVAPTGFGPVSRGWLPRRKFAGTYDTQWINTRAPLWPGDFDERFFLAASEGLTVLPQLRGSEAVFLTGVSPDGPISFYLPCISLVICAVFGSGSMTRTPKPDALLFIPEQHKMLMVWRAAFPVRRGLSDYEHAVIREARNWEMGNVG